MSLFGSLPFPFGQMLVKPANHLFQLGQIRSVNVGKLCRASCMSLAMLPLVQHTLKGPGARLRQRGGTATDIA
jgi:hypothetical protein